MSNLAKGIDEQAYRARTDRRFLQGQIVDVDPISHTARVDVGATDVSGNPIYLEEVPFQPQSPPTPGDTVAIAYGNANAQSRMILGSQLAGQSSQASITVVGAKVTAQVSGGPLIGPEPTLNFIPGVNISGITAVDSAVNNRIEVTIDASGGGGGIGVEVGGGSAVGPEGTLNLSVSGNILKGVSATANSANSRIDIEIDGVDLVAGANIALDTSVAGQITLSASGGSGGSSSGPVVWNELTVTGATTILSTDSNVTLVADNSAAAYTISIPAPDTSNPKRILILKRAQINANQITLSVNSGGTIEGNSVFILGQFQAAYGSQFESVILQSDASTWKIFGGVQVYGGNAGAFFLQATYISANDTVGANDTLISADNSSRAISLHFPQPGPALVGRVIGVRRIANNGNSVTCFCSPTVGTEFENSLSSFVLGSTTLFGNAIHSALFVCTNESSNYTWRAFATI